MDSMSICNRLPRRILAVVSTSALALSAFGQFPGSHDPIPKELEKGWDSITISQAKQILTFLANECEGRGSGQPGFQKAADFVAGHFKAWGLKPLGDNGTYFQNVPFTQSHFQGAGSFFEVIGTSKTIPAGPGFRISGLGTSASWTSVLAVIRPSTDSFDLAGADLRGRIVLVDGEKLSNAMRIAITRLSPAAVLLVAPVVPPPSYTAQRITTVSATPSARRQSRTPFGTISKQAAAELLSALTFTTEADKGLKGVTVQYSRDLVRLNAVIETQKIGVPNVVALLEGTDPTLNKEFIGIGGHLDHLGKQGEVVYPGADDDGSGSTAVLSIAHAMVLNPVKPKRSILFMTFCGEELGLIGSSWLVAHPPVPLNKMVAELQMDMVARDSYGPQNGDQRRIDVEKDNLDTIRLVGSKRISTQLDRTIQVVNKSIGFRFKYDAEDVYTRSDHYNFARNNIPIAFLFDGFTPDYHQPGDTVDKIDFLKLTNAAKLYYLTAYAVSDNPEPPKHDVVGDR